MADNNYQNLSNEHEDILHDFGVDIQDLPIKFRSKFNNITSLKRNFEQDPENSETFSLIQSKITVFSDELQKYLEQNIDS